MSFLLWWKTEMTSFVREISHIVVLLDLTLCHFHIHTIGVTFQWCDALHSETRYPDMYGQSVVLWTYKLEQNVSSKTFSLFVKKCYWSTKCCAKEKVITEYLCAVSVPPQNYWTIYQLQTLSTQDHRTQYTSSTNTTFLLRQASRIERYPPCGCCFLKTNKTFFVLKERTAPNLSFSDATLCSFTIITNVPRVY